MFCLLRSHVRRRRAAQLLLLLSEENPALCNQLLANAAFQQHLGTLMAHQALSPHLRVLAAGILFHSLKFGNSESNAVASTNALRAVITTLVSALEIDPIASASELRARTAVIEAQLEVKLSSRAVGTEADSAHSGDMEQHGSADDEARAHSIVAAAALDGAAAAEHDASEVSL